MSFLATPLATALIHLVIVCALLWASGIWVREGDDL